MSSYNNDSNENKPSKLLQILPWALLVIVAAVLFKYILNNSQQQITAPEIPVTTTWQPPRAEDNNLQLGNKNPEVVSYHDAVATAAQSVVNIYTTQKVQQHPYMEDPVLRHLFEHNENTPRNNNNDTNLGSGVIVSEDGYIVTNAHVIAQADEIIIALNDGRKSQASVVGVDSESDLAVIKVKMEELKPLAFRSNPIRVGDVALAIGNPFGVGQTVTQGIISATGRTGLGVNTFEDFIQTDAAINPGNSGGALVDAYGKLVGINTMIFSRSGGSMGIGFAIPTALVEQVMNALIEHGRVSRGWLGIEVQSHLKDPTNLNETTGVTVMNVIASSPAAKSGLIIGDVILTIDDKEMKDANTLVQYVARKLPNTVMNAKLIRGGKTIEVAITLAERPSKNGLAQQRVQQDRGNQDQKEMYELPDKNGDEGLEKENNESINNSPNAENNQSGNSNPNISEKEKERLTYELLELFKNELR